MLPAFARNTVQVLPRHRTYWNSWLVLRLHLPGAPKRTFHRLLDHSFSRSRKACIIQLLDQGVNAKFRCLFSFVMRSYPAFAFFFLPRLALSAPVLDWRSLPSAIWGSFPRLMGSAKGTSTLKAPLVGDNSALFTLGDLKYASRTPPLLLLPVLIG